MEGVLGEALELRQADLGQPPEALDAVDVNGALGELVAGMIDAEVAVAEVDQAIVAALAVGVDDGARIHPAADDALQGWLRAVGNDLGIDLALALDDAEDDALAVGAASAPPLDPTGAEEAFIDLDDPEQGALCFAVKQNAFAQAPSAQLAGALLRERPCDDTGAVRQEPL